MAADQREQQRRMAKLVFVAIVAYHAYAFGRALMGPTASDSSDPRIRDSAFAVVIMWPVAAAGLLLHRINPAKFAAARTSVRFLYSFVFSLMILHIAVAFHLGHAWSHDAAYEHTERAGGFGAGVYVNEFFLLLWLVELIWMWSSFDSYLRRPAWLNALILGFMGFIYINAAFVFATNFTRIVSAFAMAVSCCFVWRVRGGSART